MTQGIFSYHHNGKNAKSQKMWQNINFWWDLTGKLSVNFIFITYTTKNEIPLSFFISQSFYSSEWKYKIIFACQVAILIDSKFDLDSPLFQFQRKTKSLSKHLWQFVPVTSMDCIFFCGQIDLGNLLIF